MQIGWGPLAFVCLLRLRLLRNFGFKKIPCGRFLFPFEAREVVTKLTDSWFGQENWRAPNWRAPKQPRKAHQGQCIASDAKLKENEGIRLERSTRAASTKRKGHKWMEEDVWPMWYEERKANEAYKESRRNHLQMFVIRNIRLQASQLLSSE